MTFEFQGAKYRIGFRHAKPLDWGAHRNHNVVLEQLGPGTSGPTVLMCETCGGLQLSHLSKSMRIRSTVCVILREDPDGWKTIGSAAGKLNVKAGDRFEKEAGRIAALAAALESLPEFFSKNREFRNAAWAAYWNRIQKKQQKVRA